jgi:ATP-dependent protease ClpP protease subunit
MTRSLGGAEERRGMWPTPPSTPEERLEPTDPQAWMHRQLFDRRIMLLSGDLADHAVNGVGVALMTLDATGDDPVQLQIDSGDGTIAAALALMDIIDLLGVPVRASARPRA